MVYLIMLNGTNGYMAMGCLQSHHGKDEHLLYAKQMLYQCHVVFSLDTSLADISNRLADKWADIKVFAHV